MEPGRDVGKALGLSLDDEEAVEPDVVDVDAVGEVAAGVVTWTGREAGYGNTVEVSHGDGYVTRYAHNKQSLVAVGDLVRKGEPIALVGSTGRSTGSHVHYEVYKHGRPVDPSSYVARTRR